VNFLIDAQLPPALAQWLREAGHSAQAVREIDLREGEDGAIWAYALKTGAVIITKDEDFAMLAQQEVGGPVVVWLRIGNTSNRVLRTWLMPQINQIVTWIELGNQLIEVS
jgi:predicted nuclease of predicted toxin-antitoxin system